MKTACFVTALSALLAGVSEGLSLREKISNDMALRGQTKNLVSAEALGLSQAMGRVPKNCMPKKPSSEERTCANTNLASDGSGRPANMPAASCKNCYQECSIMGDPHAFPFYSKCSMVVGTDVGNFNLYTVPANGKQDEFAMTIDVYANKGKKWIKTLLVNGEEIMDASECWTDKERYFNKTEYLYSDAAAQTKNAKPDIELYYEVFCRKKSESKGAEQLIINIRLRDEEDTHNGESVAKMPPDSTFFFKSDSGICVDPVKYGHTKPIENPTDNDYKLVCTRQSEFKYTSGRFCNCSASCAAWGDPHLMAFPVNQKRSAHKANFITPITSEVQYNMMYHAEQVFAFQTALSDPCQVIVEGTIYAMKPRSMQKLFACNKNSGAFSRGDISMLTDGTFKDDDYDVIRINTDVCEKFGKNQATTLQIPSDPSISTGIPKLDAFNKEYYDAEVGGFNLGEQVLVNKDGRQYLVPVSGGHSTCLKNKGFNPDEASKLVKFGGVYATLVCHQNKRGEWYFNACVNKKSMVVQDFVKFGKELEKVDQLPTAQATWNSEMIMTLEEAAFTGGFCATGDLEYKQGASVATAVAANTFEYRAAGEVREFARANSGA